MNKKIMIITTCCLATFMIFGQVIVTRPTVVATPVVARTAIQVGTVTIGATTSIPAYSYGYYNNVYCPTYSGYYWYNDAWVWGGGAVARPPIPLWRPPHHRPAPPPPRPPMHRLAPPPHHGGPRPGGFHHGGFHHGGFHHGGFHGGGHHRR